MITHVDRLPPIWATELGLDIETNTRIIQRGSKKQKVSDPYIDKILSVAISDGVNSWYLTDDYSSLMEIWLDPNVTLIMHNAEFDLRFLAHELGVMPRAKLWDTLLIERLIYTGDYNYRHGLDDVLARRFGVVLNKQTRETFSEHVGDFTPEQEHYIEQDVLHLPRLREAQLADVGGKLYNPLIDDCEPGLGVIAWLELAVLPVTVDMGLRGVDFDVEKYAVIEKQIKQHVKDIEGKFVYYAAPFYHDVERKRSEEYEAVNAKGKQVIRKRKVPYTVNERKYVDELEDGRLVLKDKVMTSTVKMRNLLNDLGVPCGRTAEGYLLENFGDNPFVKELLEYRMWNTLLRFPYPAFVNPRTGRIHCRWNQLATEDLGSNTKEGTTTGRYTAADPNLQQVPKDAQGKLPAIRACFRPKRGYKFVVADYSQQEPRILAQLSRDPKMIEAAAHSDIYAAFGVPVFGHVAEKGSLERDILKIVVLGHFYGAGGRRIGLMIGADEKEGWAKKNQLDRSFPRAKVWSKSQLPLTVKRGYNTTLWGRRRYWPEIKTTEPDRYWIFEREIINMPVQGSAADIGKLAMYLFYTEANRLGYDAHIVMVIHDEIVVECKEEIQEEALALLEKSMLDAMRWVCPNVLPGVEAKIKDQWEKV
jgi:DNA polymerase I-like protein with 3'-5' exonuclease and polymerase domains